MSEPFDSLIFDRNQSDVDHTAELRRKMQSGETLTTEEQEEYFSGLLKGSYNVNDMNRVDAAVRELGSLLTEAGYPVEYVDPHQAEPKPPGDIEITLTSDDLQAGAYLYATGEFRAGYANYVCTKSKIKLTTGKSIVVRTDLTLLQYSGFIWYDANKNFIANTFPSSSQGEAPIQWNGNFQAIPPENAVYCDIDINATGITPESAGTIYVRQELDPENAPLPDGYSRVEYIESHGTEYIDTGFKANQDTRIVFDADVLEVTSTATGLFGCRDKIGSNGFYIFEITSSSGNYNDGYGNSYTTSIQLSASGKHKIDKNKNITYIDGTVGYTYSTQTFTTPVTVTLFTVNQSSGIDERMSKLKLYSCVIYDNDIIVRYYIPCTNSSGTVGLYDTVSGAFFGNANASTVKPVELPDGYTQIEYIQTSSSGGQYINSGFIPDNNTRVTCTISNFPLSKHSQSPFGVRVSSSSQMYDLLASERPNDYRSDFGNNQVHFSTSLNISGMMEIDKNKNVTTINGSNSATNTSNTFTCAGNMYILAINNNGSASLYCESVLLYGCKIYNNSSIVRDFVPCKNSGGIIGLYDIVGNQFYANAGTGSFTAGANVSEGFTHGDVVPRPPARDYWVVGDIITMPVWTQYIQNVQNVRDAYYAMTGSPMLPAPTAPLTFDGANAIEKLMYDISQLYDAMKKMYRICGTFNASNSYLRQYIRSI